MSELERTNNPLVDAPQGVDLRPLRNPIEDANRTTEKRADWQAVIGSPVRLSRRARKRHYLNALKIENAARHIDQLPGHDETLHCIMRGNYNGWDLAPAIQRLAAEPIDQLLIGTLGFNRGNAAGLFEMLEAQTVRRVLFVCSVYYQAHEPGVCDLVRERLRRHPGSRFAAVRSHAKVLGCLTAAGAYVVESSANLRSCRMVEQFTLTNSRELFDFHQSWLEEMAAADAQA